MTFLHSYPIIRNKLRWRSEWHFEEQQLRVWRSIWHIYDFCVHEYFSWWKPSLQRADWSKQCHEGIWFDMITNLRCTSNTPVLSDVPLSNVTLPFLSSNYSSNSLVNLVMVDRLLVMWSFHHTALLLERTSKSIVPSLLSRICMTWLPWKFR